MYDPRFRMAMLVCMIVFILTAIRVVWEYVIGDAPFDLELYVRGVATVSGALIGGFLFVLISTKFITFERYKRTGFEASFRDETGTGFNFPVSLSRFVPDIIAKPMDESLHPVESEIIGFLNGYRDWPLDISGHDRSSLYDYSMRQWKAMSTLENATHLHRIAALAQSLGKVYVYVEKRKRHPLWKFWMRDTVKYGTRCFEHGGHAAFVLSTMPTFMRMPEADRRAVLIAVRYCDNPTQIPANCSPTAMDIYESLHRARQIAETNEADQPFSPSPEDITQMGAEIEAYFHAIFRSLELNPMGQSSKSDGIYLGDGTTVLRMPKLTRAFAPALTPKVRTIFQMWGMGGKPHPVWPVFIQIFRDMGLLVETFDNVPAQDGLSQLRIADQDYSNSIILRIDKVRHNALRESLDALPSYTGFIEIDQDEETLLDEVKRKAAEVDQMMAQARAAV